MTAQGAGVECLSSFVSCQALREPWDSIVARQDATIMAMDTTSGFDWAMALWQTHLNAADQEVAVLRDDAGISGILPLYRLQKTIRGVPCRTIAPFTELYGGRNGFLLREPGIEPLEQLFAGLEQSWDVLLVTAVEGSAHEELLLGLVRKQRWRYLVASEQRSPYFSFLDNWENHFASLPKKFRSTMRNGEKRLRERGVLGYRECRTREEVVDFLAALETIERDSWKAAAGTSIASDPVHDAFHRDLALRAADSGRFSGHLLYLNDEPIAYLMGLLQNGVFLDLKESYRASFRDMSPGHVLKYFAFPRLYEHGTRLYDFMGKCEEYKLKWTDQTYLRRTYLALNNTVRGAAVRLISRCAGKPIMKAEREGKGATA